MNPRIHSGNYCLYIYANHVALAMYMSGFICNILLYIYTQCNISYSKHNFTQLQRYSASSLVTTIPFQMVIPASMHLPVSGIEPSVPR